MPYACALRRKIVKKIIEKYEIWGIFLNVYT